METKLHRVEAPRYRLTSMDNSKVSLIINHDLSWLIVILIEDDTFVKS